MGRRIKWPLTAHIDELIRRFNGHVPSVRAITGYPYPVILYRAIDLGVRKKGEHQPTSTKYAPYEENMREIDASIRRHKGFLKAIKLDHPAWTVRAIKRRAQQIGVVPTEIFDDVTCRKCSNLKIYTPSEDVDNLIRLAWGDKNNGVGAVKLAVALIDAHAKVAKTIRWSEGGINRRAAELGLTRNGDQAKLQRWTPEEDKILVANFVFHVSTIQQRLLNKSDIYRTQAAILRRINFLRVQESLRATYYSMDELRKLMHTDTKTLLRWITNRYLKATQKTNHDWIIKREHVREFMLEFPDAVDIAVVDKIWLFDILSNGRIGKQDRNSKMDSDIRKKWDVAA